MFDILQHLSMADKIMGDFYLFILAFQHFSLYEYKFPLWYMVSFNFFFNEGFDYSRWLSKMCLPIKSPGGLWRSTIPWAEGS